MADKPRRHVHIIIVYVAITSTHQPSLLYIHTYIRLCMRVRTHTPWVIWSSLYICVCTVIGFDMGGTSTDVSRYDGTSFEHVFESSVNNVPIRGPQLDIQTVAAGGGSRLFYKNGLFVVGPESVRAHPGISITLSSIGLFTALSSFMTVITMDSISRRIQYLSIYIYIYIDIDNALKTCVRGTLLL